MSTIAVFLALTGGSFAVAAALENDSVKSKHVKDNQLKSADLKDGKAVGGRDLVPDEALHVVGTAGEPQFGTGGDGDCLWSDKGFAGFAPVGFYRDTLDRVHLTGLLDSTDGAGGDGLCDASDPSEKTFDHTAFILPEAYRPRGIEWFASDSEEDSTVIIVGGRTDGNYIARPIPAGAVIVDSTPTDQIGVGAVVSGISWSVGRGGSFAPVP
jgi:hypothetical protein